MKKKEFEPLAWKAWCESTRFDEYATLGLEYREGNEYKPGRKEHLIRMVHPQMTVIEIAAVRCLDDKWQVFSGVITQAKDYSFEALERAVAVHH